MTFGQAALMVLLEMTVLLGLRKENDFRGLHLCLTARMLMTMILESGQQK